MGVVDGTLIPTRDHRHAMRRSSSADAICGLLPPPRRSRQSQRLRVYRGSSIEALCHQHGRVLADGGYRGVRELVTPVFRATESSATELGVAIVAEQPGVEHAIARLKNWRILRDRRRRGCYLTGTLQAIAFLHNPHLDELRDNL